MFLVHTLTPTRKCARALVCIGLNTIYCYISDVGETGVNWDKKHIFADCMVGVQIGWAVYMKTVGTRRTFPMGNSKCPTNVIYSSDKFVRRTIPLNFVCFPCFGSEKPQPGFPDSMQLFAKNRYDTSM